jgi:hypothetical protein
MTAALDRAVANALGLKSVNNCEKWRVGMNEEAAYLGDGVYASFDGYQIWLAVNHHENNVVALEPEVFANLCKYVEMLKEKNG